MDKRVEEVATTRHDAYGYYVFNYEQLERLLAIASQCGREAGFVIENGRIVEMLKWWDFGPQGPTLRWRRRCLDEIRRTCPAVTPRRVMRVNQVKNEYTEIVKRIPLSAEQCTLVRQNQRLSDMLRRHLSEVVLGIFDEQGRREDKMWDSMWEKAGADNMGHADRTLVVNYVLQELQVRAKPDAAQSDKVSGAVPQEKSMARITDVIAGLEILAKYNSDGEAAHLGGAEHDIIYGPSIDAAMEMTTEDREHLETSGWHWDAERDRWVHSA